MSNLIKNIEQQVCNISAEIETMTFAVAASVVYALPILLRENSATGYTPAMLVDKTNSCLTDTKISPLWVAHGISFYSAPLRKVVGVEVNSTETKDSSGKRKILTSTFGSQPEFSKLFILSACSQWKLPFDDGIENETKVSMLIKTFYNSKRLTFSEDHCTLAHRILLYPYWRFLSNALEDIDNLRNQYSKSNNDDYSERMGPQVNDDDEQQYVQDQQSSSSSGSESNKRRVHYWQLTSKKQRKSVYQEVDKGFNELGYCQVQAKLAIVEDLFRYEWYTILADCSTVLLTALLKMLVDLRNQMDHHDHPNEVDLEDEDSDFDDDDDDDDDTMQLDGEDEDEGNTSTNSEFIKICLNYNNFTAAFRDIPVRYITFTDDQRDAVLRHVRVAKAINTRSLVPLTTKKVILHLCKYLNAHKAGYECLKVKTIKHWIKSSQIEHKTRGVKLCKEFIVEVFNELIVGEAVQVYVSVSSFLVMYH